MAFEAIRRWLRPEPGELGVRNYPGRAYPPREGHLQPPPEPIGQEDIVVQVPPVGQEQVAAGATVEFRQSVNMVLVSLAIDVPKNVAAYIEVDGSRLHNVNSGGQEGGLTFGSFEKRTGRTISRVYARFVNSGPAVDVRYVLHGFAGGDR